MPNITKVKEAQRIAQVVRVIALVQSGKTLTDSLEIVGISVDVYYDWISKATEATDVFYNLIQESERRELAEILAKRERALKTMLDKVVANTASTLDIIAALTYMDKRQDQLESRQGVANQAELNAHDYLTGPKTQKMPSRMTATVVLDGAGSVTVTRTDSDIIEATVLEDREGKDRPSQSLLPESLQGLDLEADPSQMT